MVSPKIVTSGFQSYTIKMKTVIYIALTIILFAGRPVYSQSTVTDWDGNVYPTVTIGEQVWMKANLKAVHYSDGYGVFTAKSYNNSDSLSNLYGRLYDWNSVMRDSKVERVQGVCPTGWHVPSDEDWADLEVELGGPHTAGGKMKSTAANHWTAPNSGATNSSGFSGLPGGEMNGVYSSFFLHEYAFFWSSTETSSTLAIHRLLSYDNAELQTYTWEKDWLFSVRCVRDAPAGINDPSGDMNLRLNNPVRDELVLSGDLKLRRAKIEIYNLFGQVLYSAEKFTLPFRHDVSNFPGGVYSLVVWVDGDRMTEKFIVRR